MRVADLTVEELENLIRATVEAVLDEYVVEDDGAMKPAFIERLRASLASGDRGVPLEEAARSLGLDW